MKAAKFGNGDAIERYIHCSMCLDTVPTGQSPQEWSRYEVGLTKWGIQIWCARHKCNIMHINFEGERHPADMTATEPSRKSRQMKEEE